MAKEAREGALAEEFQLLAQAKKLTLFAAGAATQPTQKIWYITGKWQIMNLLGKYHDKMGANFLLGQFHDDLVKNGSLPISIIEWILLDDPSGIEAVLK